MLAMPALSKPVLYNGTIAGMPNKIHEGIFLDIMLRKGTGYNGVKNPSKSCLKNPKHKNQPKNDNKNPYNSHQPTCFKSDFIATKYGTVI